MSNVAYASYLVSDREAWSSVREVVVGAGYTIFNSTAHSKLVDEDFTGSERRFGSDFEGITICKIEW